MNKPSTIQLRIAVIFLLFVLIGSASCDWFHQSFSINSVNVSILFSADISDVAEVLETIEYTVSPGTNTLWRWIRVNDFSEWNYPFSEVKFGEFVNDGNATLISSYQIPIQSSNWYIAWTFPSVAVETICKVTIRYTVVNNFCRNGESADFISKLGGFLDTPDRSFIRSDEPFSWDSIAKGEIKISNLNLNLTTPAEWGQVSANSIKPEDSYAGTVSHQKHNSIYLNHMEEKGAIFVEYLNLSGLKVDTLRPCEASLPMQPIILLSILGVVWFWDIIMMLLCRNCKFNASQELRLLSASLIDAFIRSDFDMINVSCRDYLKRYVPKVFHSLKKEKVMFMRFGKARSKLDNEESNRNMDSNGKKLKVKWKKWLYVISFLYVPVTSAFLGWGLSNVLRNGDYVSLMIWQICGYTAILPVVVFLVFYCAVSFRKLAWSGQTALDIVTSARVVECRRGEITKSFPLHELHGGSDAVIPLKQISKSEWSNVCMEIFWKYTDNSHVQDSNEAAIFQSRNIGGKMSVKAFLVVTGIRKEIRTMIFPPIYWRNWEYNPHNFEEEILPFHTSSHPPKHKAQWAVWEVASLHASLQCVLGCDVTMIGHKSTFKLWSDYEIEHTREVLNALTYAWELQASEMISDSDGIDLKTNSSCEMLPQFVDVLRMCKLSSPAETSPAVDCLKYLYSQNGAAVLFRTTTIEDRIQRISRKKFVFDILLQVLMFALLLSSAIICTSALMTPGQNVFRTSPIFSSVSMKNGVHVNTELSPTDDTNTVYSLYMILFFNIDQTVTTVCNQVEHGLSNGQQVDFLGYEPLIGNTSSVLHCANTTRHLSDLNNIWPMPSSAISLFSVSIQVLNAVLWIVLVVFVVRIVFFRNYVMKNAHRFKLRLVRILLKRGHYLLLDLHLIPLILIIVAWIIMTSSTVSLSDANLPISSIWGDFSLKLGAWFLVPLLVCLILLNIICISRLKMKGFGVSIGRKGTEEAKVDGIV